MAQKLTETQVTEQLARVPDWQHTGESIQRTYGLSSFAAALVFASTVGHLAEAMNHHPDILIQWKNVTLTLSTHSAGGLTALDFDLARQVDALPTKK